MTQVEETKFLCSYGGGIIPRATDGKLRYVGGHTRVLSVDRSISFVELMVKLGDLCGRSVLLRCQLPEGDLETLVSITSDEDLCHLMDEYDKVKYPMKIRAVLSPPKSLKSITPPHSPSPLPLHVGYNYFYTPVNHRPLMYLKSHIRSQSLTCFYGPHQRSNSSWRVN